MTFRDNLLFPPCMLAEENVELKMSKKKSVYKTGLLEAEMCISQWSANTLPAAGPETWRFGFHFALSQLTDYY